MFILHEIVEPGVRHAIEKVQYCAGGASCVLSQYQALSLGYHYVVVSINQSCSYLQT